MKKFLILSSIIFFAGAAYAREVPIDYISKNASEQINIISQKIQSYENIDITIPFSANDKIITKQGLNLSVKENDIMDKILSDQSISPNEIEDYVSVINKLYSEKSLSNDEKRLVTGIDKGEKESSEVVKYLLRKRIKEI